jgi:hypothetical protein
LTSEPARDDVATVQHRVQDKDKSKVASFREFASSIFREEEGAMQANLGQTQ